tara:strand:- start:282 stop:797 length:516 start_codon:yes stop_codon:yes gene_type:complete
MGNNLSNFTIIRVKPTITTDQHANMDVVFTGTEIPNAVLGNAGCSMLMTAYIVDYSDQQDIDMQIHFTQESTSFGSLNATANITEADLESIGYNGFIKLDADQARSGAAVDNATITQLIPASGNGENVSPLLYLQAKEGTSSVYAHAIVTSGTPTFTQTDDLELVLHIKYK